MEKINSSIEQRVNAAVQAGINQNAKQYDQANTVSTIDLKAQVDDLKANISKRHSQISTLSSNIGTGDNKNQNPNTRNRNRIGNQGNVQAGGPADKTTWTTDLLFSNDWTRAKLRKYKAEYRLNNPTEYKAWKRVRMMAYQARELAKLD